VITILDGYPDDVLAVSATGHITAQGYNDFPVPEAEARLQHHETLRFLYCIYEGFEGFAPGALMADAGFRFGHLNKVGRTALVTDVGWIADADRLFVTFFDTPFRVFSNAKFDAVRDWVLDEET